ncbi:MAG: NUDIX hydrolase [Ruminococcaceae bacterium]|nr:NUDIX hydrolase [Oscillospiraceae bacterium]
MLEKEKLVKSESIFEGRVIRVKLDTVEVVQNGNITTRELVEHPGGVAIVAINDEGKICLVRQYRRPFDEIMLEIPAGKLEWGEDHRECGIRELREETGYSAKEFVYLGEFYVTPGFCNEKIHIYLATELVLGEKDLDENEFTESCEYTFDELVDMIMNNEIKDAKTVIGIMKAREYLNRKNK